MKAVRIPRLVVLCALLFWCGVVRGEDCTFTGGKDGDNPVAVDDLAFFIPGGVTIPVLANDVVAAGGFLVIHHYTQPGAGRVTLSGSSLIYTPNAGVSGPDFFEYTIRDSTRPTTRTSTGTVEVRPQATVTITGTCTGGDCLFDAVASPPDGVMRWEWRFPNESFKPGGQREYHQFDASGTYPVTARAIYHTGAIAEKTLSHAVTFARELIWTCVHNASGAPVWGLRNTTNSDNCTAPHVTVHVDSFRSFEGKWDWWVAQVKWAEPASGDRMDEMAHGSPSISAANCNGFSCTPTSGQYKYSGTHRFKVGMYPRQYAGGPLVPNAPPAKEYSGLVVTTNTAPAASFRFEEYPLNSGSRRYFFYPHASTDDLNLKFDGSKPYEWDYGDGHTGVFSWSYGAIPGATNTFQRAGDYVVTLKVTDLEDAMGTTSQTVSITNTPPVLRTTGACNGLRCRFTGNGSTDDFWGENPPRWTWSFGNGQSASVDGYPDFDKVATAVTEYTYPAPGCYATSLTTSDIDDAGATKQMTVAVGTQRLSPPGSVTVDAHASSYRAIGTNNGVTRQQTTGNLNGIAEPGEAVVVEPTWAVAPSATPALVFGQNAPLNPPIWYMRANGRAQYNRNLGISDCWNATALDYDLGPCEVLIVSASDTRTAPHYDIPLTEAHPDGGNVTTLVHVGASFNDVSKTAFYYPAVESLLHSGITTGCGGRNFCPGNTLSRQELAAMLVRGKYGASYTPPPCNSQPYTDVTCDLWSAAFIAKAKADNLIAGYPDGTFRPTVAVTRAMMAEPLLRASAGMTASPPCENVFTDVSCGDASLPGGWISELKRRGITAGCTTTTYCPTLAVDRGSTALFLVRAFNLGIDYKVCAPGTTVFGGSAIEQTTEVGQ
ncbi:MAG TPA: PKD domain-containing protein [Thermoanaerobaculia bacterium]|nr:PKD domain-containing protein [Thermoanaerobaculia bacterium]